MDESWRMRMGLNNLPRRRSTEESSSSTSSICISDRLVMSGSSNINRRRNSSSSLFELCNSESSSSSTSTTVTLDPENFNDVFGGPPRSIVSRQFSRDASAAAIAGNKSMNNNNTTFYEEIFRSSEFVAQAKNNTHNGRKFPGFGIPERNRGGGVGGGGGGLRRSDGFYDDIFGSDNEDRRSPWRSESRSKLNINKLNYSKSKSKSNSSSVLSSEDLSPLRPSIVEDVFFTSFTSKLRPINVPGRRNPSSMRVDEQHRRGVTSSDIPWITHPAPLTDHHQLMEYDHNIDLINENYKMSSSNRYGFSHSISSPETISIELPNSYRSCSKIPMNDGLDIPHDSSPSSSVVSLHKDLAYDDQIKFHYQDKILQEEEEEEEEVMSSSYVIEFNNRSSDQGMRSGEATGIDEAIAWAKEKFQNQCLEIFEGKHHQQQIIRLSRSPPEPTSAE